MRIWLFFLWMFFPMTTINISLCGWMTLHHLVGYSPQVAKSRTGLSDFTFFPSLRLSRKYTRWNRYGSSNPHACEYGLTWKYPLQVIKLRSLGRPFSGTAGEHVSGGLGHRDGTLLTLLGRTQRGGGSYAITSQGVTTTVSKPPEVSREAWIGFSLPLQKKPALPLFQTPGLQSCETILLFSSSVVSGSLTIQGRRAPLCMGFSRQEYCSGLPFPPPGDLPPPGIKPVSPAGAEGSFTTEPPQSSVG